jgi:uncharacterized protein (TIGR02145 family)
MKTTKFMLPASILLVTALTFSCSPDSNGDNPPSSSKEYRTVEIGEQIWLAENLNYNAPNSKCYGEDGKVFTYDNSDNKIYERLTSNEVQANCEKYGRLYDWATAMALPSSCNFVGCESQINNPHRGICPEGYHIPSYDEWVTLYLYVDDVSAKLKSTSGWTDPHDGSSCPGTDEYGFSALPGGRGGPEGSFDYNVTGRIYDAVGNYGHWWSVTEEYMGTESLIHVPYMAYYGDIDDHYSMLFDKSKLFSVRCLQD